MLKLFRRHVRLRAVATVLAVAVCGGTIDWGHTWDDPSCDPAPVQHDQAAHRFTGAPQAPGAPGDHCVLCHLQRLLHTTLSAGPITSRGVSWAAARRPPDGVLALALLALHVPSRAPPAVHV